MSSTFTIAAAILLFFALLVSPSSSLACNKQDEKALLAFKNSFLYTSLKWSPSTDCCTWDFVGCDNTTGRVTSLHFENNNINPESVFLNGSIPSSVGDLSSLETLRFRGITSLNGPIPPQLSKLKKLQSLEIYVTQVSGPVPSFLSELTSLKELKLGYNKLSGTIPPSLGSLAHLADIGLFGNQLTGTIPASLFGGLNPKSSLVSLVLSHNKLTGSIPRSLADVRVSSLYLQNNNLDGDASFLFGRSKFLTQVSLANNNLAFDLDKVEFPLGLLFIDISHNKIYGSIPAQIVELPNLSYIDVSSNRLCGKIPSGGKFVQLPAENYEHNKCLCGTPLMPCK
ncbi:polygalacturonase inhibitor-like [Iris pallida]|uniref:Polygalacturonase inhibitor-like n=1 Tax=Iris pallida TaxID=29817 RepID=A0AAX6I4D6_IRIPA|nr:polygalacturonase inhibitor-like [Iris pallida]